MSAFEDGVDGRAESGGHVVFASGHDGGPGGVEQDVADAGLAVQQDGDAGLRPPMRAIFASTLKSFRHSLRRYSLVTMVLPPVRRPCPMMRLETAMRSLALALRACWSPKRDGVSCMRTWKPRIAARVAW